MIINNNIPALNTHRQLGINQNMMQKSMEKLSSGMRINRAGDDAAGLAISEKMRAQIRGLDQASRNAQDGISMIQTAEGGLNEVHSILQRMRELAVQASNDTNVEEDRTALNDEFQQLKEEIGRIEKKSQFNKQNLFDATAGDGENGTVNIQVGANSGDIIAIDLDTEGINLSEVSTAIEDLQLIASEGEGGEGAYANAQKAIDGIEAQIANVSSGRSYLGAMQNRLEHTITNLDNSSENLQAAESRIRDVDMAREMMEMTKSNILSQASQSMLAQANQMPQSVLQLLQ